MHRLYAATLALAAFLLFWAELLFGRLLLPLLGGTPGVWATCLLFFQTALLLGYGLCRITASWAGTKRQVLGALGLLLLAGLVLPLGLPPGLAPDGESSRVAEILLLLAQALGRPFLAVSIFSPLLQTWYGQLGRPDSADPSFLYGASNAGSLLALVLYPLVIEPRVPLSTQAQIWSAAFGALVLAFLGCAAAVLRSPSPSTEAALPSPDPVVPLSTKLRWVWLSFLPASLLYGVTTTITTDIAPIPLLWAAPLAIYLASFVFAFARRTLLPFELLRAVVPVVVGVLVVSTLFGNRGSLGVVLALHLGGFAVVACVLHRDLASLRPEANAPGQLEGYYLWIALGGLLGGIAAVIAPVVLHTAVEYPWALLLAALLASPVPKDTTEAPGVNGLQTPAPATEDEALAILSALTANASSAAARPPSHKRLARAAAAFAAGVLACVLLSGFSGRFFVQNLPGYLLALIVLGAIVRSFELGAVKAITAYVFVLLIGQCALGPLAETLHVERSFFGVQRVVNDEARSLHSLHHGTTVHGRQSRAPGQRRVPLAYYGREGPAGEVFERVERRGRPSRVGVVGLGVGSLAAYAQPEQVWVFFEIDSVVEKIARDPALFSFLEDAPVPIPVKLGDGRLSLAAGDEGPFDLLVLDAFSSDAIPVHLLTREAFEIYLRRLSPKGLLLANVSNRFLDLESVFAAHAKERGLVARIRRDLQVSPAAQHAGLTPSAWILVGRKPVDLLGLSADRRWTELNGNESRVWTDDHADVLGALGF